MTVSKPSPSNLRPRASAAVLRNAGTEILMVKHRQRDGSDYWQLPGGGLSENESLAEAALRELAEETGLVGNVLRELFTIPYKHGLSTTFLLEVDSRATAQLGTDPEDERNEWKKLVDLAWVKIEDHKDNPEIKALVSTGTVETLT